MMESVQYVGGVEYAGVKINCMRVQGGGGGGGWGGRWQGGVGGVASNMAANWRESALYMSRYEYNKYEKRQGLI